MSKKSKQLTQPSNLPATTMLVPTHEPWLTPEETARELKLPNGADSIYCLTRADHPNPIPSHRVGRHLRFLMSEVNAWAKGQAA